jgi:hypothetical protein
MSKLERKGVHMTQRNSANKVNRGKLRKTLVDHFSKEELITLCFDLGIEHENLPETKGSLSMGLVEHCEHHGMIPKLLDMCRQSRSDVAWDDVFVTTGREPVQEQPEESLQEEDVVLTLVECLPGNWQIQVMMPYVGVTAQGTLEMNPDQMFRAQFVGALGVTMIQGRWQVTSVNQVMLQGQQTIGIQVSPYMVMLQFGQITPDQLAGVTSTGEQVLWQRIR